MFKAIVAVSVILATGISFDATAGEIKNVGRMKLADSILRVNTYKYDEISPTRITMYSADLREQSTQIHFLTIADARHLQKVLEKAIARAERNQ